MDTGIPDGESSGIFFRMTDIPLLDCYVRKGFAQGFRKSSLVRT